MSKTPSYLREFLAHPSNRLALLAAACTAIVASIPYGGNGFAMVGVVTLGLEALAALTIPDLPAFRVWADRKLHRQARDQRRERLQSELRTLGDTAALATYQHMCNRVASLYQTAGDPRTTLSRDDVERLEDLTVDYLGLSAVHLSLRQRKDNNSEDGLQKRITAIQNQLTRTLSEDEQRQLRSTLAEYTEALHRARRLAIRRSTLEATLLAMPDKMEEVYQLVIAAPYSAEMGKQFEESLSRLRIAEEVAAEFDGPALSFDLEPPAAAAPTASALGKAARSASIKT